MYCAMATYDHGDEQKREREGRVRCVVCCCGSAVCVRVDPSREHNDTPHRTIVCLLHKIHPVFIIMAQPETSQGRKKKGSRMCEQNRAVPCACCVCVCVCIARVSRGIAMFSAAFSPFFQDITMRLLCDVRCSVLRAPGSPAVGVCALCRAVVLCGNGAAVSWPQRTHTHVPTPHGIVCCVLCCGLDLLGRPAALSSSCGHLAQQPHVCAERQQGRARQSEILCWVRMMGRCDHIVGTEREGGMGGCDDDDIQYVPLCATGWRGRAERESVCVRLFVHTTGSRRRGARSKQRRIIGTKRKVFGIAKKKKSALEWGHLRGLTSPTDTIELYAATATIHIPCPQSS